MTLPPPTMEACDALRMICRPVPLIGFDAGYGLEAHSWQFILVVGV